MESEEEVLTDESNSENEYADEDFLIQMQQCNFENKSKEFEQFSYQVLSTEEIIQDMIDCIKEVNLILQMPTTVTRILLNHFNWDKDKLMEKYYDGDQEKLFEEAHIASALNEEKFDSNVNCSPVDSSQHLSGITEHCNVCYLSLPPSELTGLECGHRFCMECWNKYLSTNIMEGFVRTIACAAFDCGILVDDVTVMKLLKEASVRLRYQQLITKSFVECNKLMRWCSGVDCNNAIKVQYFDAKPVTCKCNKTFCFACGEDWHDPINCELLRKWLKKCQDESETSNWVGANTKDCPRCYVSIEKNGGCNYIQCQKCRHEFCWICMNHWNAHPYEWNLCNKYVETSSDVEAMTKKEKQKAALSRYLFYNNRFMSHSKSLKLENELYDHVQKRMDEMQQVMSWIEVQFLKVAVDVLLECRRTLMYAYAFAYYLEKTNNQTEIFEINQRDLEFATETLSAYLERDITVENYTSSIIADIKQKVQDKYTYCENRRKVLLEHVHEGYDNDTWEYLDL